MPHDELRVWLCISISEQLLTLSWKNICLLFNKESYDDIRTCELRFRRPQIKVQYPLGQEDPAARQCLVVVTGEGMVMAILNCQPGWWQWSYHSL